MLNHKEAARTGMPTNMRGPANKTISSDFQSLGHSKNSGGVARQTLLTNGANGTGLWVH